MFYCRDRSGCLHFGATAAEASQKAAEANREIR